MKITINGIDLELTKDQMLTLKDIMEEELSKPEKLEFKEGDWLVTYEGVVGKVCETNTKGLTLETEHGKSLWIGNESSGWGGLKYWKPKENEYCFFKEEATPCFLSIFKGMEGDCFLDEDGDSWENCEPFVGVLPNLMKNL